MKRVKFLKKGRRGVHGNPREPLFVHLAGEEMDVDDATADYAIGQGAAEFVEVEETEDDEAGDQAGDAPAEGQPQQPENRRQRRAREKSEREAEERGDSPLG